MQRLLFYLIILLIPQMVSAQWIEDVLQKIKDANSIQSQVHMNLSYKLYKGHHSMHLIEENLGSFHRNDQKYKSEIYGTLTIQNEHHHLMVSEASKTAVLSDPVFQNETIANFDWKSLLSAVRDYKKINSSGIRIFFNQVSRMEYDSLDIFYNSETYILETISFYHHFPLDFDQSQDKTDFAKPRLEIHYKENESCQPSCKENYSTDAYLRFVNKKPVMTNAFKAYQLIDHSQ